MSGILLDTHAWLWLMSGSRRLGQKAQRLIQQAAEKNRLSVSAISIREIAVLVSKGKISLDRDVSEWVADALSVPGVQIAQLTPDIAIASTRLPGHINQDPADQILVATARHFQLALMTADSNLLDYSGQGHLKAVDASR